MKLRSLYGNTRLKEAFSGLDRDNFPHTVIIRGEAGTGKKTLARIICAALLCERGGSDAPCLECAACKKVLHGTHSEITVLDDSDGRLKIDRLREMRRDAAVIPADGDKKICVIYGSDRMSAKLQNGLLKILEEPPAYAYFILLAENAELLLPTVRSRAQEFSLMPLTDAELSSLLADRGYGGSKAEEAVRRCRGIAGRASELLSSSKNGGAHALAEEYFSVLCKGDKIGVTEFCLSLEKLKKDKLVPFFDCVRECCRNAAFESAGVPAPTDAPVSGMAERIGAVLPTGALCELADTAGELAKRLEFNAGGIFIAGVLAVRSDDIITKYNID